MSERSGSDGADGDPEDGFPISRRWLIRLLVGLGVGIPVAIEGATLLGLVGDRLFGGDGEGGTTTTTTPRPEIGVDDELLPETAPTDRLTAARIDAGGDDWQLVLSVRVQNTGNTDYELVLGDIAVSDGTTVAGEFTTGRLPPGESAFVTGTWTLPTGTQPERVAVTATSYGEKTEQFRRQVPLEGVPVER